MGEYRNLHLFKVGEYRWETIAEGEMDFTVVLARSPYQAACKAARRVHAIVPTGEAPTKNASETAYAYTIRMLRQEKEEGTR